MGKVVHPRFRMSLDCAGRPVAQRNGPWTRESTASCLSRSCAYQRDFLVHLFSGSAHHVLVASSSKARVLAPGAGGRLPPAWPQPSPPETVDTPCVWKRNDIRSSGYQYFCSGSHRQPSLVVKLSFQKAYPPLFKVVPKQWKWFMRHFWSLHPRGP